MYLVRKSFALPDVLGDLAMEFYRGGSVAPMDRGTKVEQARKEGLQMGFRDAITRALAKILTFERVKKFYGFGEMVQSIDSWNVQKVLTKAADNFKAGATPDDEELDAIIAALLHLVDGNDGEGELAAQYEKVRRQLVLAGEQTPTKEDREGWLKEHLAEREAQAESVRRLIEGG